MFSRGKENGMRNFFMLAVFALSAAAHSAEYKPEDWNLKARQKFADQRFGVFIHWGLYANYAQGEWYLQKDKLDEAAYSRMMYGFYPSRFDAREWVRIIKGAGAKYITITSRHHDGFSLWPTKVDDGYNIANTPFRRDILGELAAACREEGIQLNFYYSLMDWHRADYPAGFITKNIPITRERRSDYASYKKFMLGQIAELIDSYRPGVIWFDGEWEHARETDGKFTRTLDWQMDSIYDFIHARRTLAANNNHQPIREREDIQLFERDLPGENAEGFSKGQTVTLDRPIEQCDVIQKNVWGYKIGEKSFRSASEVVAMVVRAAAKDSNLLMNIGPDGSGQFPAKAVSTMAEVGGWFAINGESVYGTRAGGVGKGRQVVTTRKGDDILYVHFLDPAVNVFSFKLDGKVASATLLDGGGPVDAVCTADGTLTVSLPKSAEVNYFDRVVKIHLAD
jgi:alpha-L-fucosidase